MSLPDDYDFGVDLPATIKLEGGKVLRLVGCLVGAEKEVAFFKTMTEEEWKEEMEVEDE